MKRIINKLINSGAVQDTIKKEAEAQAQRNMVKDALSNLNFKRLDEEDVRRQMGMKKGGYVKKADGCAKRGKTKGRMV
jgi:hypothetical protein